MNFESIIRKNHPELDIIDFKRVTGGWASDTFEVNGKYIFRFPRLAPHKFDLRKEIRLLPTLSKALSIRVPDFQFIDRDIPYVGYRKIEGLPIIRCDLGSGVLAGQMAHILFEMHSFPVDKALELGVLDIDWKADYSRFYEKVGKETFNLLEEQVRKNASKFFEAFLGNEKNFSFAPRFIHRDLSGADHILCDIESNKVVGIIDWEDACIGDPAIDFTGLLWDCGKDFAERVITHYGSLGGTLDAAFRERTVFYKRIGCFHSILYGQEIDSSEQVRKGIREVTAEFGI